MRIENISGPIPQFVSSAIENLPRIASNISKLAIPIIGLIAMANIPGAAAGPFTYAACVSGCELACTQAGLILAPTTMGWSLLAIVSGPLGCPILCAPALAAPTP